MLRLEKHLVISFVPKTKFPLLKNNPVIFASDSLLAFPMSKLLQGLNQAQIDAVTGAEGPTMIIAGAGSGKTRVLTTRIAFLLEHGIRPWEILALTFTNKAAGEMKERIGALLGESFVHELWMGTFHSIFARMLRRHAELLGYTKSFSIYDSDDSLALIKRV